METAMSVRLLAHRRFLLYRSSKFPQHAHRAVFYDGARIQIARQSDRQRSQNGSRQPRLPVEAIRQVENSAEQNPRNYLADGRRQNAGQESERGELYPLSIPQKRRLAPIVRSRTSS